MQSTIIANKPGAATTDSGSSSLPSDAAAASFAAAPRPRGAVAAPAEQLLAIDVVDTGAAYVLYADVPGIESAAQLTIQLSIQGDEMHAPATAAAVDADAPSTSAAAVDDEGGVAPEGWSRQQQQQVCRVLHISGQRSRLPRSSKSTESAAAATAAAAAAAADDDDDDDDDDDIMGDAPAAFQQQERNFQRFVRSWVLPDDAESEGISAQVACGVLSITVPKKTSSRGRDGDSGGG
jgi:HSP20 family molecular chaperone IbpA